MPGAIRTGATVIGPKKRLGDICIHVLDLAFWALDLKHPITVEAQGPPVNPEGTPDWMSVRWTFPARGNVAYCTGLKLRWDAGSLKARNCPKADLFIRRVYREAWAL